MAVVLITEVSRDLTQFVNPRVSLSASLLRSLLCRAELDPLPGWEGGGGGWWERVGWGGYRESERDGGGEGSKGGMAASTGAPCRDAGDGEQGGGVEGLQGATGGK